MYVCLSVRVCVPVCLSLCGWYWPQPVCPRLIPPFPRVSVCSRLIPGIFEGFARLILAAYLCLSAAGIGGNLCVRG